MSYLYQSPESPSQLLYTLTSQTFPNDFIFAESYGVKNDGITDNTTPLNNAITAAAGKTLVLPGNGTMLITGTLTVSSALIIQGQGPSSIIKYNAASGTAILPMINVLSSATGTIFDKFCVDQNADRQIGAHSGDYYIPPTIYGANIIAGSAILIQADDCRILNLTLKNAWDNGVSIVSLNSNGTVNAGSPKYVNTDGLKGKNNGCGYHSVVGDHNGSLVDVASGSLCVVSNCLDDGSAVSFTLDTGAGASADFVNCVSNNARGDGSFNVGIGFYLGSGDSTLTNCCVFNAAKFGFWFDTVNSIDAVNCQTNLSQQHGFLIKGGLTSFTNCRSKNSSQAGSNLYDAFFVDSSAGSISGITFSNCQTSGSLHKYGFEASGAGSISGNIIGGSYNGVSGTVSIGSKDISTLSTSSSTMSLNPIRGQVLLAQPSNGGSYPYMPSNNQSISGTPASNSGYTPFNYDINNDRFNVYNSSWKYSPIIVKESNSNSGTALVSNSYTTPNSSSTTYKISSVIDVSSYTSGSLATFLNYTSPSGNVVNNQILGTVSNVSNVTGAIGSTGCLMSFDTLITCQTGTNINYGTTGTFSATYVSNFKITKI